MDTGGDEDGDEGKLGPGNGDDADSRPATFLQVICASGAVTAPASGILRRHKHIIMWMWRELQTDVSCVGISSRCTILSPQTCEQLHKRFRTADAMLPLLHSQDITSRRMCLRRGQTVLIHTPTKSGVITTRRVVGDAVDTVTWYNTHGNKRSVIKK